MEDLAFFEVAFPVTRDGKKTVERVRIDELPLGFWERISKDEPEGTMTYLLMSPLSRPELAREILIQVGLLLGVENPNLVVDELLKGRFGQQSLEKLGELFVMVPSDLPEVEKDPLDPEEAGEPVPTRGDAPLTST